MDIKTKLYITEYVFTAYLGLYILDLSKVLMYEFQYD